MGVYLTLEQAQSAFSDIDQNGSGEIDFDEFFQFYEANMSAEGGLKAGFGSFFSGFSLRLRTVGLHSSKPISRAQSGNSADQSDSTNKRLSSLKQNRMTSSTRMARSRDDPTASTSNTTSSVDRLIGNAEYFNALVTGINKMAHARALGMVDTTGDGVTDAVAYDTKGDGVADAFDTTGDGEIDAWDLNGNGKMDGFDTTGDGNVDAWDTTGDGLIDAIDSNGDGRVDRKVKKQDALVARLNRATNSWEDSKGAESDKADME